MTCTCRLPTCHLSLIFCRKVCPQCRQTTSRHLLETTPNPGQPMEGERQPLLRRQSEESAASTIAPRWKTTALALYFTLVVCQGGAQFGFLIVFSSPLLDDFQVKLPYNFTVWSGFNECAYQDLVGPMGPVGAVFGSILSSPVVAVTGYVTGMVVMSGLSLVGWLLIAVSYFTYYGGAGSPACFRALLFLGRFLTGVGAGWAAGVVPVSVLHSVHTAILINVKECVYKPTSYLHGCIYIGQPCGREPHTDSV